MISTKCQDGSYKMMYFAAQLENVLAALPKLLLLALGV
jgi:hypothetical protein